MESGWKEDGGKMEGVWRENRWRMMESERGKEGEGVRMDLRWMEGGRRLDGRMNGGCMKEGQGVKK
jgi:hypothetical protein